MLLRFVEFNRAHGDGVVQLDVQAPKGSSAGLAGRVMLGAVQQHMFGSVFRVLAVRAGGCR